MPELLRIEDRTRLLEFLEKRFGIEPGVFNPYLVYAFKRQAFLFRRQKEKVAFPERAFVRCGLPFMRLVAGYLKPTTVFLQRFGKTANKNVLYLTQQEIVALCVSAELHLDRKRLCSCKTCAESPGYVIIKMCGNVLGAGLLLDEGRLLCRFPKTLRQALARVHP